MVGGISADGTVAGGGVGKPDVGLVLQPAVAVNAITRTTARRDNLGYID